MKGLIGFSSQEQLDDDLANEFEADALDVKVHISVYMYSQNQNIIYSHAYIFFLFFFANIYFFHHSILNCMKNKLIRLNSRKSTGKTLFQK